MKRQPKQCSICEKTLERWHHTPDDLHCCEDKECKRKLRLIRLGQSTEPGVCAHCKQPIYNRKKTDKPQYHRGGPCAVAKVTYWRGQLSQADREVVRIRTNAIKRARENPHTVLSPTLSASRGKIFRGGRKRRDCAQPETSAPP